MKFRTTTFLFIISIIIASIYFYYVQPMAEDKKLMEDFEKRFFRADTSDIEFIKLDAGRGPVTIVQKESEWRIKTPAEYKPDIGVINKIFETLSRGRLMKIVGDKYDLDDFGFDKTWVVLSLGYKGNIDVLRIAGENPSSTGNYAYAERFGKIFLINKELGKDLNLKPYDLREKRFFLFKPDDLGKIRIKRQNDTIEILKEDDEWKMVLPRKWYGSSDDIKSLIDILYTQKAAAYLPWERKLGNLSRKMYIELFDRRKKSIGSYDVYFWGTEWNKGILMHTPGSKEAARTRREFWDLLNGDHTQFMYRNLFEIKSEEAVKIQVSYKKYNYEMEKKSGQWYLNELPMQTEKVISLINDLNSWKAVKLVKEDRLLGKDQFVIEITTTSGLKKLEVSDFNMDYEVSGSSMFVPIESGKPETKKIDYWYTRTSNLKKGAVVSSIEIEKILNEVKHLNE